MTDQNQLESDADDIRAGIAETAEAIQDKLNPGKMMEELLAYMKNSDGALAFANLSKQARDNPMALAMIGAGMAWLVLGDGKETKAREEQPKGGSVDGYPAAPMHRAGAPDHNADEHAADGSSNGRDDGGFMRAGHEFGDRAKGASQSVADGVSDAAKDASDRMRRLRHDAVDHGHAAVDEARSMAARGRRAAADAMANEPLVLGALAVAVGAAIGAMLPNTRFEDETFGETGDSLKHDAEQMIDRAANAARNVGEKALDGAKTATETA